MEWMQQNTANEFMILERHAIVTSTVLLHVDAEQVAKSVLPKFRAGSYSKWQTTACLLLKNTTLQHILLNQALLVKLTKLLRVRRHGRRRLVHSTRQVKLACCCCFLFAQASGAEVAVLVPDLPSEKKAAGFAAFHLGNASCLSVPGHDAKVCAATARCIAAASYHMMLCS